MVSKDQYPRIILKVRGILALGLSVGVRNFMLSMSTMTQEGAIVSKLDELADKSSGKSGTTANYLAANQALRNDIFAYIDIKIDPLLEEIKV